MVFLSVSALETVPERLGRFRSLPSFFFALKNDTLIGKTQRRVGGTQVWAQFYRGFWNTDGFRSKTTRNVKFMEHNSIFWIKTNQNDTLIGNTKMRWRKPSSSVCHQIGAQFCRGFWNTDGFRSKTLRNVKFMERNSMLKIKTNKNDNLISNTKKRWRNQSSSVIKLRSISAVVSGTLMDFVPKRPET